MSYLELRDVSKVYGEGADEVHALRGIDLSVERGALVAVMGPSGSGKSTLLTIAGSLEEPTSGEVLHRRRLVSACRATTRRACVAARSATCSRTSTCSPGSTAVENVSLPLELDGIGARKARVAGMDALEELGLTDRAVALSRRALGRRAATRRDRPRGGRGRHLLLADEPSGALDSTNAEAVMRLVLAACHRGVAAVVVTHDAQLASWADRVVFLRDGRIVDQTMPPPSARVAARDRRNR